LAELAVHHLDMVIADRAMPKSLNVLGYSHFLGQSGLSVFAAPDLAATLTGDFPACLDGAPFLLPGADVAIRPGLLQWFEERRVYPRVVGEFDDSALLKAFGQSGAGIFAAPSAIAGFVCAQYRVSLLGVIDSVREQLYVITTQRRLTHPAVAAVCQLAREEFFGAGATSKAGRGPARQRA
jgi:LysR family transcriptional activator of nhaA